MLETLCLLLGHNYWLFALIEVLVLHFYVLYFFLSEKKRATHVISRVESSKLRSKQIYFFSKPVLENLLSLSMTMLWGKKDTKHPHKTDGSISIPS